MDRGIVLLSVRSKNYGYWAFNMALSIRYFNPDISIQVIHDDVGLSDLHKWQMSVFDVFTPIDSSKYSDEQGFQPGLLKMDLYKHLKFKRNIILDVDGLALKDLGPLFDACEAAEGKYFTDHGYRFEWADDKELKKSFGVTDLNGINTSFQYVERSRETSALFKAARENFKVPVKRRTKWGSSGAMPDELYMSVALKKKEVKAFEIPNTVYLRTRTAPSPIAGTRQSDSIKSITEKFYFLGAYGMAGMLHPSVYLYYDQMAGKFMQETFGVKNGYHSRMLMRGKYAA